MNRLHVISPGVWVSRLALLLAGFFFVPCLAFGQTEIPVEELDGSHFTPLDDAEYLQEQAIDFSDEVLDEIEDTRQSLENFYFQATNAWRRLAEFQDLLRTYRDRFSHSEYADFTVLLSIVGNRIHAIENESSYKLEQLDTYESEVSAIRGTLMATLPDYVISVGGTNDLSILQDIYDSVHVISNELFGEGDRWDGEVTWLVDMCWNFLQNADISITGRMPHDRYEGQELGRVFGKVVSNEWDTAYYLNLYTSRPDGIYNDSPPVGGPAFLREMWAYILRPYAQLLAVPDYSENPIINGFRGFYAGWPARYVYPTNTVDDPLFVSMSVGDDVETPIWVSFTNSVTLSSESLEGLQFSFSNAVDLSVLEDMTFTVRVTNAQDLATAIFDEQETRLEEALSEAESSLEEPSEETTPMPSVSFSFGNQIGTHLRSIATSYRAMFSSIPGEMPSSIMVWQGGNFAGVEVQSIHWNPNRYSSSLSAIRTLFSFAWYLVYVYVVFVSAAIDLMVCGVIVYMVYGLLSGRSDVAYHGMLWCYKSLCTFLGYKPQSVS